MQLSVFFVEYIIAKSLIILLLILIEQVSFHTFTLYINNVFQLLKASQTIIVKSPCFFSYSSDWFYHIDIWELFLLKCCSCIEFRKISHLEMWTLPALYMCPYYFKAILWDTWPPAPYILTEV